MHTDVSHSGEAVQTLRAAVIRAKEALSFALTSTIEFAWNGKTTSAKLPASYSKA